MLPMRKFGNKEVVDWKAISKGFEFMLNETRCEVVSNEMVSKVSRNGRVRKERRLTVRVVGTEVTIEISSTSFKNMSFGKRLAKAMGEAPKPKAQREPKAKRTYKKEAKRDLPCGLTEEQRKAYIRKYGYAFIVTPEGTFTAPEYEAMKQEQERKEQEEREREREVYNLQMEINSMAYITFGAINFAKEQLVYDIKEIANDCLGWHIVDVDEYLEHTFGFILHRMELENEWQIAVHEEVKWQLANDYGCWLRSVWNEVMAHITKVGQCTRRVEPTRRNNNYYSMFIGKNEREMKRIYRKLSKELHPDMGGDANEFKAMHKAYECGLDLIKTGATFEEWSLWNTYFNHVNFEEYMKAMRSTVA